MPGPINKSILYKLLITKIKKHSMLANNRAVIHDSMKFVLHNIT
jgi:hypothetical protein